MLRFTLAKVSLPLALALALAACGDGRATAEKDAQPEGAPPALAKPAGADDGKPVKDDADAAAPTKDAASPADAPMTAKDDAPEADEDADEGAAEETAPKRRADKRKKVGARRRASSGGDASAPEAAQPAQLGVKRIQLSQQIEGREPVDPDETFSARDTDVLYAFVEITNPEKREGKIFVSFVPPMGQTSKVTLKVGDVSRWRTWAKRKSPKAVGTWHVVVSDERGRELSRRSFEVTE